MKKGDSTAGEKAVGEVADERVVTGVLRAFIFKR